MSKKKATTQAVASTNGNGRKPPRTTIIQDGKTFQKFFTSLGVEVRVGPLPPMLPDLAKAAIEAEWLENGKPLPVVPTYETTNLAGEKQRHEHDATTLDTDEEKAQWAAYLKAKQEFDSAVTTLSLEECLRHCVDFDIQPHWPNAYKRLRPPADPDERKFFFARAAVIGSGDDLQQIMAIAATLTGVDTALIDAVEASFRPNLEKPNPD